MKFILIKAENNYSDEFDVQGFALYRGEAADRALNLISKLNQVPHTSEVNFGTNESVRTIDTVFEISEIKQDDYYRIISHLGEDYGILNVDWVLESIERAI